MFCQLIANGIVWQCLVSAAFESRAHRLGFFVGAAAIYTNAFGSAHTALVMHAFLRIARDGHTLVGRFVAHVVGGGIRNIGVGIAAGFIAAASLFALHLNLRTAAAMIFVAGAVNHMTLQFGHSSLPFRACIQGTNASMSCQRVSHTYQKLQIIFFSPVQTLNAK